MAQTQQNNHSPWSRGIRGMQVHAVPDSDKAFDAQGRKLPWAYSLDPNASNAPTHSEPVEKGPFGRSTRRNRSTMSRSRSKTAEPGGEKEKAKMEQEKAEDAVFGSLRRRERDVLGEADGNTVAGAQQAQPAAGGKDAVKGEIEATEVMLYGFGEELQWAALDHYERVSGGLVLEDYDRQAPGQRYDVARSLSRATNQRSLTRAALKKKNTFAGGLHWIKITYDSRGAAELACARSPHIIKGHLVYAEPYLGRGPGRDEPIMASQAGAQITDPVLPTSFSTNTLNPIEGSPGNSSTTASSATATTTRQPALPHSQSTPTLSSNSPSSSTTLQTQPGQTLAAPQTPATIPRRRISGVTPAQILPVDAALMPKPAKASWSSWLGAGEVIGSTVPKKDDGSFDYDGAGVYWRVWWWVDRVLGTDWLGMKAD
ncbi:hypothetical protein LTR09_002927 [Extremus antarcticus]|uniref:Nucleoporin NUP53 n=1 Tax=Extremus antarcticus TaxID=702011 RepID=A0AAJ0LV83_9PEZI|nr:hypothetical protein LTR09_002927 [Extremus antarcticus]